MSEAKPVSAQDEIEAANTVFEKYGFAFYDLAASSPKSDKTRRSCAAAVGTLLHSPVLFASMQSAHSLPIKALAQQCGVGVPTLLDIAAELCKPGRDPRDELPAPILRTDVLELKDLKPGMVLSGTVRNVIDFGVFVDIGVHQDGLVHISQVSNKFIKHPSEVVSVGDVVKVAVLDVDQKRGRISLTMKGAK